jgi:hypothetical protein
MARWPGALATMRPISPASRIRSTWSESAPQWCELPTVTIATPSLARQLHARLKGGVERGVGEAKPASTCREEPVPG